jgi:hypothetical protein
MADASAGRTPTNSTEISKGRRWLTSTFLVILTLVVAIACITVLSVTLTQTRVSTTAGEGGTLGIRKLDYAGRKWAVFQAMLESASTKLVSETGKTDQLVERVTITEVEQKGRFNDTELLLVRFQSLIRGVDDELVSRITRKGHDVQVSNIAAAKDALIAKSSGLAVTIDAIEKAWRDFRMAEQASVTAKARLKANENSIEANKNLILRVTTELDKQFELVKPGLANDKDARGRVENAFYELNINNFDCGLNNGRCGRISGPINRGFYHLLTLRPDLLTLILVILMGVLGSSLQINHAYFMKNEVQSLGGYVQRISVGAMTALVIFIVAKAGIPVLADPARLGGDAPINPYFVSFLAIVSGLLSENAIANIQAQGRRIFGGSTELNRWMRRDMTPDMEAQELTIPALAKYLGLNPETTTAMLKGEKEIDPSQQKLLAVALRLDPREIYTDVPPPE